MMVIIAYMLLVHYWFSYCENENDDDDDDGMDYPDH